MDPVSGPMATFGLASFGGFLVELLKWYNLRESLAFPAYARGLVYWGLTLLMILVGGCVALLYGSEPKSPLLVVNIGASAPLLIKAMAETARGHPRSDPLPEPGAPPPPGFKFGRAHKGSTGSIGDFLAWR